MRPTLGDVADRRAQEETLTASSGQSASCEHSPDTPSNFSDFSKSLLVSWLSEWRQQDANGTFCGGVKSLGQHNPAEIGQLNDGVALCNSSSTIRSFARSFH